MGLSHITVMAVISLSGLLPSSCTKTPAAPQHAQTTVTNAAVAQSKTRDLGVVQLTNHYETEIDLGTGKSCSTTVNFSSHCHLEPKTLPEGQPGCPSRGSPPNPTSRSTSPLMTWI
jgi:hypothetical protein